MEHLLLVENQGDVHSDVKQMLERHFGGEYGIMRESSLAQATAYLRAHRPLLVLTEINSANQSAGICLAERSAEMGIPVIFMAPRQQWELFERAKRVHPFFYLFRPIEALELKVAVELTLARSWGGHGVDVSPQQVDSKLSLLLKKRDGSLHRVKTEDVISIESRGNYCCFHTAEGSYWHRMPIKNFPDLVPSEQFVRVHRRYVINLRYFESIHAAADTVVAHHTAFPLSKTYKSNLIEHLGGN